MFRASPDSSQIDLLSNVEQFLRKPDQVKFNDPAAWHNVFLDQVVQCVPEKRFAELFDDATGRPNAPLRVLVGMLILKEGFGWSDEELFEAVHFNLLVRRALGLLNLTDKVPVESTYSLFKQRLYAHQVETGVNRLQEVFQELTGDQARRLGVVGEKLRMEQQHPARQQSGRLHAPAADQWGQSDRLLERLAEQPLGGVFPSRALVAVEFPSTHPPPARQRRR